MHGRMGGMAWTFGASRFNLWEAWMHAHMGGMDAWMHGSHGMNLWSLEIQSLGDMDAWAHGRQPGGMDAWEAWRGWMHGMIHH